MLATWPGLGYPFPEAPGHRTTGVADEIRCERKLAEPKLRQPQRKALTILQNHWAGLTVFVNHPEVPMDNNKAERRQRGPVVGRKNFYGSGALWSGRLAA